MTSIKPNLRLLTAIRAAGMRQREFSMLVGDHETAVSQVINGRRNLDDDQQRRYAQVLGCKQEDLFD